MSSNKSREVLNGNQKESQKDFADSRREEESEGVTMATGGMTPSEVKAECDRLECSPSQSSKPASSGGKGKLIRNSAKPAASGSTGTFENGHGIPGYRGKFARGARQE